MENQPKPLPFAWRRAARRPALWLIRAAERREVCPACGARIEPGAWVAWHHPSTLYFHPDCAGLRARAPLRRRRVAPRADAR